MASNTTKELNYDIFHFALPEALARSVQDLQNTGTIVAAIGVALTTANVGTFSRQAIINAAYQNPGKKF
jgi:hypothetical protein